MKKLALVSLGLFAAACLTGGVPALNVSAATPQNGWYVENGQRYWYENGVRQGTEGRGKEIYDPSTDAWYWLDAEQGGAVAVSKDVYQESNGGKWVRYDANGHMVKGESYADGGWYRFDEVTGAMIKGWYTTYTQNGQRLTYYYDLTTGQMVHGEVEIDEVSCIFDKATGVGLNQCWYEINGVKYWYEDGKRQGTEGRGKEIYDPVSDAWYWLDAVQDGAMAVSKDVYQESNGGKWVRYDANGHMVKGHNYYNKNWYYFDLITGAMAKGWYSETGSNGTVNTYYFDPGNGCRYHGTAVIDGVNCAFDDKTGIALDQKWYTIDGKKYWYEGGKRQGTSGRGKEIYDPASGAWYWLDAEQGGAIAVDKDVYQESNGGKWVRYDKDGHMVKGWNEKNGNTYYFDLTTGAMVKGTVTIGGLQYTFNKDTGVLEKSEEEVPMNYVWQPVKYTYLKSDGTLDYTVEKTYDDKGNLLSEITKDASGNYKGQIAYSYDADGNMTRHTVYNARRQVVYQYKYLYDSEGRETEVQYTNNSDSSKSYRTTSTYNNNGLATQTMYNGSGTKTGSANYWYRDGRLVQKTMCNPAGTSIAFYVYEYDKSGNRTEERYYLYSGSTEILQWRDTYQYDRAGNCIRYTEYDADGNEEQHTTYSYYNYGGYAYEKSVLVYNQKGSLISGYEYERNGSAPVKYTKYLSNWAVDYYIVYGEKSYPTDTNIKEYSTKDVMYNSNGSVKQTIVTEYELGQYAE